MSQYFSISFFQVYIFKLILVNIENHLLGTSKNLRYEVILNNIGKIELRHENYYVVI